MLLSPCYKKCQLQRHANQADRYYLLAHFNSLITCDVVDGVESNSEFPHFEGVLCLDAALQVLYALPVLVGELRVIVGQQRWSLVGCQVRMDERCPPVLPAVEVKLHRLRSSIVGILNNLLKKLSRPSDNWLYRRRGYFFPVLYKTSSLALPDPSLTLREWRREAGENKHR